MQYAEPTLYGGAYDAGMSTGYSFGMILFWLFVLFVSYLPLALVFKKAGREWWKAIIPIYNLVVLLQIVKKPVWWLLLMFVPIVNFVILIVVYNELSKAFGHGVGFTLGLIFFSFLFMLILGLDSSKYLYGDEKAKVDDKPKTPEPLNQPAQ